MAEKQATRKRERRADLTGQRFGFLVVTALDSRRQRNDGRGTKTFWRCECDCGASVVKEASNLASGNTQSCGCFKFASRNATHGKTATRLYHIWVSMKARCFRPACKAYDRYGGSGITVCSDWKDSFAAFHAWAIANGYSEDLTLDRYPNQKGNYEPSNCRWATQTQQQRNRSDTIYLELHGETKPLCDWADEYGIRRGLVYDRLGRGWDVERAITSPSHVQ